MMKRQTNMLLAGLMLVSLVCSSAQAKAGNHDGLVAGLCAAGAALIGVAGAVALTDWCCSETDDQLIARVEAQYREIFGRYHEDMTYFGSIYGTTESVLHEFATHVWRTNVTQQDYRSHVCSAKNNLQSCVQALRKRIAKGRDNKRGDAHHFRTMQALLNDAEKLLANITTFADVLESHRDYFNLHDAIDTIRAKYFHEISLFESGRYAMETEIKRSIVNRDNSLYPFRNCVINIKDDISTLESKIRSLKHQYNATYAYKLIDYLVAIKNIVVNDPRYQRELYEWEQAELQRMRIKLEKERVQAERDRAWAEKRQADALREQNRLCEQAIQLERERLWNQQHLMNTPDVNLHVQVII